MTRISIDVVTGSEFASATDVDRARSAAEAVLDGFEWRQGDPQQIDPAEAEAAYTRHTSDEDYLRSPRETVLIAAWSAARAAADAALTEGWRDVDGASCEIHAA
jgi:hypothetical protein